MAVLVRGDVVFLHPLGMALSNGALVSAHMQQQAAHDRNRVLGYLEAHAVRAVAERLAHHAGPAYASVDVAMHIHAMLVANQAQHVICKAYIDLQSFLREVRTLTPNPSSLSLVSQPPEKKRKRA